MRTWREKCQAMAMAVTFAEAGEWDTAKSFLRKPEPRRVDSVVKIGKRPDQRPRKQLFRV
jgi:hypothetical protein